jgi:hypothetical protein
MLEMGGVWESRSAYRIWAGNVRGRDHLKDLGVDVRIILIRNFNHDNGVMKWIAEDREKLRAFVKWLIKVFLP